MAKLSIKSEISEISLECQYDTVDICAMLTHQEQTFEKIG